MRAYPPPVGVWAVSHGLTPTAVVTIMLCWLLSALACYVALPPLAPTRDPLPVDLQLFGLVALATTAGATSLLLHDAAAWMPAISPRRIEIVRLGWAGLLLLGTLSCGLLTTLLLPDRLPPFTGYLAIGLLWWAASVIAAVFGGQMAGLLTPLILAVMLTVKIVPWKFNVVFHPGLDEVRLATATVGTVIATTLYSIFGSARDRRRR